MCVNGEGAKIGKLTGSPTVVTWAGDQSQSQSRTLTSAGHTFQHTRQKSNNNNSNNNNKQTKKEEKKHTQEEIQNNK